MNVSSLNSGAVGSVVGGPRLFTGKGAYDGGASGDGTIFTGILRYVWCHASACSPPPPQPDSKEITMAKSHDCRTQ